MPSRGDPEDRDVEARVSRALSLLVALVMLVAAGRHLLIALGLS